MYTSLLLVALVGPDAVPRSAPETPSWQETYSAARKAGRDQGKPLAVFIGAGKDGWGRISRESKLSTAAEKTLVANYVCVYVDTKTAGGRRLAEAFGIKDGAGLVLSTRDGGEQAFRHEGRMSRNDLETTLRRFGNGAVSSRTETLAAPRVSGYYAPGNSNGVTRQQAAPVMYSSGGFGGFRGGAGC